MLSNEGKRQSNDIPDFVRDKPGGCALALWLSYNIPTIYSLKIPEVSRSCYSNNVFCSHLGRTIIIISWTAIDHTPPTHVAFFSSITSSFVTMRPCDLLQDHQEQQTCRHSTFNHPISELGSLDDWHCVSLLYIS